MICVGNTWNTHPLDFIVSAAEIREVANDIFRSALITDQIPED